LNSLVCVEEWMNFIYYSRFLISSCMKLDSVVLNVVVNTSYGLINITSSSSTVPLPSSFFCSLSLYKSWISLMLSSMYLFSYSLYVSNLLANIL